MPIYEYLCQSCAYRFEVKQGMKDDPIKSCSRCGQEVTRLISSPAIMFKGSGWYVTDYSDKLKPTAGSEGPEKANDKTGDERRKVSRLQRPQHPASILFRGVVNTIDGLYSIDLRDIRSDFKQPLLDFFDSFIFFIDLAGL